MYKKLKFGQVSNFDLYDVTVQMRMHYKKSVKYTKLRLYAKRERLRSTLIQNPQILAEKALEYKKASDDFVVSM